MKVVTKDVSDLTIHEMALMYNFLNNMVPNSFEIKCDGDKHKAIAYMCLDPKGENNEQSFSAY